MISPKVAGKLGLMPIGKMAFVNIRGEKWHNAYLFHAAFAGERIHASSLQMPQPVPQGNWSTFHKNKAVIKGGELPAGRPFDILLSMDVIRTGRLEIDSSGHFSFTFSSQASGRCGQGSGFLRSMVAAMFRADQVLNQDVRDQIDSNAGEEHRQQVECHSKFRSENLVVQQ